MFEFLSSANKHTIETQIDYFERAIRDSKSNDTYYPEAGSPISEPVFPNALRRPSEESISKAREWISIQRKEYSDSKEILALCDRWEWLFEEYRKKMEAERAKIQSDAAAAQKGMRKETSPASAKPEGKSPKKSASEKSRKPSSESAEKSPDVLEFNRRHLGAFASRIERVRGSLVALETFDGAKGVQNASELRELSSLLEGVVSHPDEVNVVILQQKIASISSEAKFTVSRNDGRPDGLFGELTMGHLERILRLPAPESRSDGVPKFRSESRSDGAFRMKDGTPVRLKDGTPVVGMRFESGKVWVIGKNGQRVEMSAFEGSKNAQKTPEALTESARKLEPLADDALVLLSAVADHAAAAKWKSAPDFSKRVSDFEAFLSALDVSDYGKAKSKIVEFVHSTFASGTELEKEFREVFQAADNDADRRKKVYEYVRGSFWPNRRNAGFDGAAESLSRKLATRELERFDVSQKSVFEFVTAFVDTELRTKSAAEVAKTVMNSKGQVGILGFLARAFPTEKSLAAFVEDLREANEELEKAYESKEAKKAYDAIRKPDGKPLTQEEIASMKLAGRKAKLAEFVSASGLSAHIAANPALRTGNFELETFADIEGVGAFDLSDKTKRYVRNELWKDIAIEAAAIGVGAVTAGWGAVAVHGLAAARLGNRAREMASVRLAVGTVWGWAGFEAGHGGIRSVIATARNEWTPTSAYSWESLAQAMAFWGAFSIAGEVLRKAGIAIDVTKRLSEQKAVLAAVIGADSTAALGVSYGISSWQGEKWTAEEALQAVLMAAAFRGAMVGAEKFRFRAVRDPETGAPSVVSEPLAFTATEVRQELNRAIRERSQAASSGAPRDVIASYDARIAELSASVRPIGSVASARPSAQPRSASAENAPRTATPPAASEVVRTVSDENFERFAYSVASRLKKPGDQFVMGETVIAKTPTGYSLKTENVTVVFDSPAAVAKGLSERLASPGSRFEFLSKFASDRLSGRLRSLDKAEISGSEFRMTFENGAVAFEKRAGSGWQKVAPETVPENVSARAAEMVFWSKFFARAEGLFNRVSKNPEHLSTPTERQSFIAKFGERAWVKAVRSFEEKLAGRGHDAHGDAHAGHGGGRHWIPRVLFGEQGASWKWSAIWGGATQLVVPAWGVVEGEGFDRFKEMNKKDAVEAVAQALVFRYVSVGRAIVYSLLANYEGSDEAKKES